MTTALDYQPTADSERGTAKRPFHCGVGHDPDWRRAVAQVLVEVGQTSLRQRLGFVYVSEAFQPFLSEIEVLLRQTTGVPHWVGAVGHGVIGSHTEYFNTPSVSVLIVDAPDEAFRVFSIGRDGPEAFLKEQDTWLADAQAPIAFVHADPVSGQVADHLARLEDAAGAYLFGGLGSTSSAAAHLVTGQLATGQLATGQLATGQLADGPVLNRSDILSGVMFSPHHVVLQSGLTQGCSPISDTHLVTKAQGHVVYTLDGEPALDVLIRDIGPVIGDDLREIAGQIFAALPVAGSDTGDYLVRSLIGIDPENRLIAIGESIDTGDRLMFTRRGATEAVTDMRRMLGNLKSRVGNRPVRGGVYVTCCARGPNQFTAPEDEVSLIRETFGDIPLTGFFANGEINAGRFYGFTGVLALFL